MHFTGAFPSLEQPVITSETQIAHEVNKMKIAEWSWPKQTNMTGLYRLEVPPDLGRGAIEFIPLEPGILLAVSDYSFKRPTLIKGRSGEPVTGFGFCLAGQIQSHPGCFKEPFTIRSLQSGFSPGKGHGTDDT